MEFLVEFDLHVPEGTPAQRSAGCFSFLSHD
jgi:hypothetical protein